MNSTRMGVVAALLAILTLVLGTPAFAAPPDGEGTESTESAGGADDKDSPEGEASADSDEDDVSASTWYWFNPRPTGGTTHLVELDVEYRLSHRLFKGFPTGRSGRERENGEMVHSGMFDIRFGGDTFAGELYFGGRFRFADHDDSSTWNNRGRVRLNQHPFNQSTASGGLSLTYRFVPQTGEHGNQRVRLELSLALMAAHQEGLVQSRTMPRIETAGEVAVDISGNGLGAFAAWDGSLMWDASDNNTTQMEGRVVAGFRATWDGVKLDLYGGVRTWHQQAHDRGEDRFKWEGLSAIVGGSLLLGPIEIFAECHITANAELYHRSVHDAGGVTEVDPIGGRGSTVEGGIRLRF